MSNGYGRSTEGFGISREQSVNLIVQTCLENGVTDPRQIAYMLATAQHETRNFTAPEEDFGRSQARKLGYRGGEKYFGRGYVHLTHKDNYEQMDRLLGLNGALVRNPSMATDPEIAARIMVVGMRDGLFTGRKLDSYIDADSHDLYNARRTVNGISASKPWSVKAAHDCETYARSWEQRVPGLIEAAKRDGVQPASATPPRTPAPAVGADGQLTRGEHGPEVVALQQRLNRLGYRDANGRALAEDGDFGKGTFDAVVAFQKANGLQGLGVVGPQTRAALERAAPAQQASPPASRASGASNAIYNEAYLHFLDGGSRFEYGRGDMRLSNDPKRGNGTTDPSRNEQDLDRDGLKGVDCSSFVWRGLKDAGYNVGNTPFSTHALFNGNVVTAYARSHFDVIPAADARRDHGTLKQGDVLLFKDKDSGGQHVGIFKGYDSNGRIKFIGSQVHTGPAEANAGQGSYWNGKEFEIVGALRAKSEFQVRAPLHGVPGEATQQQTPAQTQPTTNARPQTPTQPARPAADADGVLQMGEKSPAVAAMQRRLFELGYRGADGKPLNPDGDFGANTLFAVKQFQREHGLEGKGMVGPKTTAALDKAGKALMSDPAHPHHKLYAQALEKVREAEKARGLPIGAHSERVAAALVVECLREGITRVDRVELNDAKTLARAVQVSPMRDESGLNRSTDAISLPQASRQTLGESSEQAHQVAVNVQAQQQDAQRRQTQAVQTAVL
ncbi:MAG TPA: peptidoglycan-binding protein [Lysobacter sp.]|nr:peptidoglycan-binding protein [Lysobacter sp.]